MSKILLLFFSVSLLFSGCKTRKLDNDLAQENENIVSEEIIDGFYPSPSSHGVYYDQHGNSYDAVDNSIYLETPDIEGFLNLNNVESLTSLIIDRKNPITDISFLQHFTELRLLSINSNNKIKSLEPLKYLNNLDVLVIVINQEITDITPIGYLDKLTSLYITVGDIDISPIKNLRNLKKLELKCWGKIENLGTVFNLLNLQHLRLSMEEQYLDLKNILALSKLESLGIYSPAKIDLTQIGTLQKLKSLTIGSPHIINLFELKNPELEELDLFSWWDSDGKLELDGLKNLSRLKVFQISNIDVYDVKPLLILPNLETVAFYQNFIDFVPLSESNTIKEIYVDEYYYGKVPYELFKSKGIQITHNGGD